MHSSSAVAVILLALSSAAPVLGAPLPAAKAEARAELEARKLPIAEIFKQLGLGALTGGGLAALTGLLGGGDAAAPAPAKRELSDEEKVQALALIMAAAQEANSQGTVQARAVGLSGLAKALGLGALSGGGLAALTGFLGGDAKREFVDVQFEKRAAVGAKVAGEVVETFGDVIKKGLLGGLGSALAGTAIGGLFGLGGDAPPAKRELTDDEKIDALALIMAAAQQADPQGLQTRAVGLAGLAKALGLGALSGGGLAALTGFLGGEKREFVDVQFEKRAAVGAKVAGEVVETFGDVIKKGLLGGLGSALAGTAIGSFFSGEKRDLTEEQEVQAIALLMDAALAAKDEGVNKRDLVDLDARALSIKNGLLGTAASLGATALAGGLIDEIKSLFARDEVAKRDFLASVIASDLSRRSISDLD